MNSNVMTVSRQLVHCLDFARFQCLCSPGRPAGSAALPSRPPQFPKVTQHGLAPPRSALKRPSPPPSPSCPHPPMAVLCSSSIPCDVSLGRPPLGPSPLASDESTLPRSTPSSPRRTLSNAYSRAVHCARSLATSSSRRRRAPRVFPSLPPPAEWAEVPLTVESDSESESESESDAFSSGLILGAHATRKVRFIVAPVLARVTRVDYDDEEPAWCDFM
ncbi:hypothetical protein DFH09DRAFT_142195 [Mycena vulgaris]|nr:hypothetical protein DFH09DRAFT_142195 [Mycena vulgaris]